MIVMTDLKMVPRLHESVLNAGLERAGDFFSQASEDVKRVAHAIDRPQDTLDNGLVFVEEYTLETERGQGRIYLTKSVYCQYKAKIHSAVQ